MKIPKTREAVAAGLLETMETGAKSLPVEQLRSPTFCRETARDIAHWVADTQGRLTPNEQAQLLAIGAWALRLGEIFETDGPAG